MSQNNAPRILFVSLTDDGGSSRIIAEFARLGAECGVLGGRNHIACASRWVSRRFALPEFLGTLTVQFGLAGCLERILQTWMPDRLIVLDEMGAHLVRGLAKNRWTSLRLQNLLAVSFGPPDRFVTALSRGLVLSAAAAAKLPVPGFCTVASLAGALAAAAELGYPLVLKREYTCGGRGVQVVEGDKALRRAYRCAALKASTKRLLMRLSGGSPSQDAPLILQAFVAGTLCVRVVACAHGKVLAGLSFMCERQHPAVTGASTIIHPVDHPQMAASAALLVAKLGASGFLAFDFIFDTDGRAVLIEMNARPIASGHLGARFGADIYKAYLADVTGTATEVANVLTGSPMSVALFPKELERDPLSPALAEGSGVFHDVPLDDPPVVALHRQRLIQRFPQHAAKIDRYLAVSARLHPVDTVATSAAKTVNALPEMANSGAAQHAAYAPQAR